MLNSYFDWIACINLDRRPDRWQVCVREFAEHRLNVTRVPAVDGRMLPRLGSPITATGYDQEATLACVRSHALVLRTALNHGYRRVLVLEDDAVFRTDVQSYFEATRQELPAQWDMLYLGCARPRFVDAPKRIRQVRGAFATSSYAVSAEAMPRVVAALAMENGAADEVYDAMLRTELRAFAYDPPLSWQRAGMSDIAKEGLVDARSAMRAGMGCEEREQQRLGLRNGRWTLRQLNQLFRERQARRS